MSGELVPFGKYKGKPIEGTAVDQEYVNRAMGWCRPLNNCPFRDTENTNKTPPARGRQKLVTRAGCSSACRKACGSRLASMLNAVSRLPVWWRGQGPCALHCE
jgi:hypothetical protein